jgi:hypothetical protein
MEALPEVPASPACCSCWLGSALGGGTGGLPSRMAFLISAALHTE